MAQAIGLKKAGLPMAGLPPANQARVALLVQDGLLARVASLDPAAGEDGPPLARVVSPRAASPRAANPRAANPRAAREVREDTGSGLHPLRGGEVIGLRTRLIGLPMAGVVPLESRARAAAMALMTRGAVTRGLILRRTDGLGLAQESQARATAMDLTTHGPTLATLG